MNIIHLVSNKVWGGGERYALDLAMASRARGHNVEVFARRKPAVSQIFQQHNLLTGNLRLGGTWDVFSPIRLAKHLSTLQGDTIIHVHNFKDAYTAIAARKLYNGNARIKIVCTRHLIRPAKIDPSHIRTANDLDAIIFVSKCALDTYLSTHPAIDHSRLHMVHNAIAAPKAAKRNHSADNSENVQLIFAGRIVPEKGLDTLINALGDLKSQAWTLNVCGTGRGRDVMPIVRAARSLGIDDRITWSGHVDDVLANMSRADIGVFPSRWAEPFGLTILEAFSQGLAVISTNQGGPTEIIQSGTNGLLVPPDNPQALASAISSLITDTTLRNSISDAGIDTFNNQFDYDRFVDKIFSIYNEC